jgi:alkylated DNA repair dioxygenase AlkB
VTITWFLEIDVRTARTQAMRRAVRWAHHAAFPSLAGLVARRCSATARGAQLRYLCSNEDSARELNARFRVFIEHQNCAVALDPALAALLTADCHAQLHVQPVRPVESTPLENPVLVIGPPRSGGTALVEALARHPALWSLQAESEGVIEGVPGLHPRTAGYRSHALTTADAAQCGSAVVAGLQADLRNARGLRLAAMPDGVRPLSVRFVEKTPENSLRLGFLLHLFPDATLVVTRRDRSAGATSIARCWQHPGFVNIPQLPGWSRGAWHFLLPEGWHRMNGAEIPEIAAAQWDAAQTAIDRAIALLPKVRVVQIDHEEMVRHPATVLRRLEKALGLPAGNERDRIRRHERTFSSTTVTTAHAAISSRLRPNRELPTSRSAPQPAAGASMTSATHHSLQTSSKRPRRRPPRYTCCFADVLCAALPDPAIELQTSHGLHLQVGAASPARFAAHRLRFHHAVTGDVGTAWVQDPVTAALWPYALDINELIALRALRPGSPVPDLAPELVARLLAASAVIDPLEARKQALLRTNAINAAARQFADNDVCTIDDLVPDAQRRALDSYYETLIATGTWRLGDDQVAGRYGWQNEVVARFVHQQLTSVVTAVAAQPVRPSYCYVSAYRAGATLSRHRDREQCEFTVSLMLGESGPNPDGWVLHLQARRNEIIMLSRAGEAVMFRGTTVEHWRPSLPNGNRHTALLLHYVPAAFRRTLY